MSLTEAGVEHGTQDVHGSKPSGDRHVAGQTTPLAPGLRRGEHAVKLSRDSAPPEAFALQPASVAAHDRHAMDDAIAGSLARYAEECTLTRAETRILGLALEGLTRPGIVREAGISVHTYQKHVRAIRDKAGVPVFQAAIQVLRAAVARAPQPGASVYEMLLS